MNDDGVREALAELVALKDMKDEEARLRQRRPVRDQEKIARCNAMRDEYNRRKPAAWAAARAALATPAPASPCASTAAAAVAGEQVPIDMVLHCPKCGKQHIDADESNELSIDGTPYLTVKIGWDNPPHRSHLCHVCGHVWRPADVPTNGVEAVQTKGKNDSPPAAAAVAGEPVALQLVRQIITNHYSDEPPPESIVDAAWRVLGCLPEAVVNRALDLNEKARMPYEQALNLAISECAAPQPSPGAQGSEAHGHDVLKVVVEWALAGHISERGVTCEAGLAIRAAVDAAPPTASPATKKSERVHALVNAGDYPGMSEAFDRHMGAACWVDSAYRQDAATWAAAWRAATDAAAVAGEPVAWRRWQAFSGLTSGWVYYEQKVHDDALPLYATPHPSPSAAEQADDTLRWRLSTIAAECDDPDTTDALDKLLEELPRGPGDGQVYAAAEPAAQGGERERFEASRRKLGWEEKTDEKGTPLLARHKHGETWWGSESTMPTYRVPWVEAQWIGWQARAALAPKPSHGTHTVAQLARAGNVKALPIMKALADAGHNVTLNQPLELSQLAQALAARPSPGAQGSEASIVSPEHSARDMRRLTALWRFGKKVLPSAVSFDSWMRQLDMLIDAETYGLPMDGVPSIHLPHETPAPACGLSVEQERKPFTPRQRRNLWNNSPELHKDATSIAGFERIVTLTERAHGIGLTHPDATKTGLPWMPLGRR